MCFLKCFLLLVYKDCKDLEIDEVQLETLGTYVII